MDFGVRHAWVKIFALLLSALYELGRVTLVFWVSLELSQAQEYRFRPVDH